MEAIFGAIYLDGGYQKAEQVILGLYKNHLKGSLEKRLDLDYKSRLQEITQDSFKQPPTYEVVKKEGPDHSLKFEVEVCFNNVVLGRGSGVSKKRASQNAAMAALVNLRTNPELFDKTL